MEIIDSEDEITWWVTENTVKSRLVDNSLLHDLCISKKIRRRTKLLNHKLKFSKPKTFEQYVKLKSTVQRKILNDSETEDESCCSDDDYQEIYRSNSSQPCLKDYNATTESLRVSVLPSPKAEEVKLNSKKEKNNKKSKLSKSTNFLKNCINGNNEENHRKSKSTSHSLEYDRIVPDLSEYNGILRTKDRQTSSPKRLEKLVKPVKSNGTLSSGNNILKLKEQSQRKIVDFLQQKKTFVCSAQENAIDDKSKLVNDSVIDSQRINNLISDVTVSKLKLPSRVNEVNGTETIENDENNSEVDKSLNEKNCNEKLHNIKRNLFQTEKDLESDQNTTIVQVLKKCTKVSLKHTDSHQNSDGSSNFGYGNQNSSRKESLHYQMEQYDCAALTACRIESEVKSSKSNQEDAICCMKNEAVTESEMLQFRDTMQDSNVRIRAQANIEKFRSARKRKHKRNDDKLYSDSSLNSFDMEPLAQSTQIHNDTNDNNNENVHVKKHFLKEILNGNPINQPRDSGIEEDEQESSSQNNRKKGCRISVTKNELSKINVVPPCIVREEDRFESESTVLEHCSNNDNTSEMLKIHQSPLEVGKTFKNHTLQSDSKHFDSEIFSEASEILNEDSEEEKTTGITKSLTIDESVSDQEMQTKRLPPTITNTKIVNKKYKIIKEQEEDEDVQTNASLGGYSVLRSSFKEESCNENKQDNEILCASKQSEHSKKINLVEDSDSSTLDEETNWQTESITGNSITNNVKIQDINTNCNLQSSEKNYSTKSNESSKYDKMKLVNNNDNSSNEKVVSENNIIKDGNYVKSYTFGSTENTVHKHVTMGTNISNKDRTRDEQFPNKYNLTPKKKVNNDNDDSTSQSSRSIKKQKSNENYTTPSEAESLKYVLKTLYDKKKKGLCEDEDYQNQSLVENTEDLQSQNIKAKCSSPHELEDSIDQVCIIENFNSLYTTSVNNDDDDSAIESSHLIKKKKSNGNYTTIPTEAESLKYVLKTLYDKKKKGLCEDEDYQNQSLVENTEDLQSENIEAECSSPHELEDSINQECIIENVNSLYTSVNNDNNDSAIESSHLIKKKKSNGNYTTTPTEAESLKYVLRTLHDKKKRGLYEDEYCQNQSLVENTEDSQSQNIEAEYSRPRELKDLIEQECLIPERAKATFTLKDLSEDNEIWILDVPKTIPLQDLQGEKLVIKNNTLKIGEKCYETVRRKNKKLSCVFRSGKRKKQYEIVNLKPAISFLLRHN